jgi:hypothetical protein
MVQNTAYAPLAIPEARERRGLSPCRAPSLLLPPSSLSGEAQVAPAAAAFLSPALESGSGPSLSLVAVLLGKLRSGTGGW